MGVQLGISVAGVEDVLEGFRALPTGLRKKYLKAAVSKVTKPYVKDVKKLVPRGPTGNLKRSVGIVMETKLKGRTQTAVLGFRRGDKQGQNGVRSGFHAWWIENGVKDRYPKNGTVLAVPTNVAKKYSYYMPLLQKAEEKNYVNIQTKGDFLFHRSVRGFRGSKKFEDWTARTLPRIRDALQDELVIALAKAQAQAARRKRRDK
jgi:hypothetical protein